VYNAISVAPQIAAPTYARGESAINSNPTSANGANAAIVACNVPRMSGRTSGATAVPAPGEAEEGLKG
jgi:hypothetical protein